MINSRSFCCLLASIALGAAQAWAIPVLPGSSVNAASEPDPAVGVIVGGPLVTPLVSAGFAATLTSTVISGDGSNPNGGLTFLYEVSNSAVSIVPIGRLTVTGYNGWLTDMSYRPGAGLPPTLMDRSPNGTVVGYSFVAPPPGITALLPGATSNLLVVQTNATAFTISTGNVINGSIAAGPAYAPIPEPATLVLLTGSLGLWLKRRR